MRNREIVGLAALACAACCIGPIVGVLGTVAALGLVSSLLVGFAGLVVAAVAVTVAIVLRRRRRAATCRVEVEPVAVELGRPS